MSRWKFRQSAQPITAPVEIKDAAFYARSDAWGNPTKQIGTFNDVATETAPQQSRPLDIRTAGELHRRGPYARVCSLFALWTWGALRFNITGIEPEQEKAIKEELDRLSLRTKGMQADEWGMAFGWSPLYMVVDDDGSREAAEPDRPFLPANTQKIYALHNIAPRDVFPLSVTSDPKLENWRQPEVYRVTLPPVQGAGGATMRVHTSRLLPFWGVKDSRVQNSQTVSGLWDGAPRPYADQIYDELQLIGALESGANRAALELVTSVFKFNQGAADYLGGQADPGTALQNRLNSVSRSLGISRKVALGDGEEFDIRSITTTGWKDLSDFGFTMLSLSTGLPKALLFGEAPSGLSTDKGSWWAQLNQTIQARREERVLPVLYQIIPSVMAALGIEAKDWGIEFLPLAELTETDMANLRKSHTEADLMLYQAGVLGVDDLRGRYEGGAYRSTLELDAEDTESGDDLLAALIAEEMASPSTEAQATAPSAPAETVLLNGAQIQSALGVLQSMTEGIVAPGAAVILLSGIMPIERAQAMVTAQKEASKTAAEVEVETELAKKGAEVAPGSAQDVSPAVTGQDSPDPLSALVGGPAPTDNEDADQAELIERRGLAEMMTQHDIDRCEHGLINKCDRCGIERVRGLAFDEDGTPMRNEEGKPIWSIVWRAQGDRTVTDSLDAEFRSKRFKIPSGATGNAKQVIGWKDEHGSAVKGMTATGWRRARQLAKGGTISGADLITIAAWFARHGAESSTKKVSPEFKDEPWRDNGYVSWLGWGGDTMNTFATDVVERNR